MTRKIPKIGEKIHRTKKGGLESCDWIDNAIVTRVDTADEQVYTRHGVSSLHFTHFRDGTVEIIGKGKLRNPISIITWNNLFYEAYNNKEEKDKIKELINDENVDNDNIRICNISSIKKVSCKVKIEKID